VISAVVAGASGDVRGVSWMTVVPDAAVSAATLVRWPHTFTGC